MRARSIRQSVVFLVLAVVTSLVTAQVYSQPTTMWCETEATCKNKSCDWFNWSSVTPYLSVSGDPYTPGPTGSPYGPCVPDASAPSPICMNDDSSQCCGQDPKPKGKCSGKADFYGPGGVEKGAIPCYYNTEPCGTATQPPAG